MKLSVAIITLNEEVNIGRTLDSVIHVVDEIVVVDNGSSDRTLEIARSYGEKVRIIHEPWRGFAGQKNFAMEQCTGDWVLSLDADEEVSPELAATMRASAENATVDAIVVNRKLMFLGRWIHRAGLYPDPKVRLVRRGKAWFEDRPVHESIHFEGATLQAKGDLIHWAYHNLDDFMEHQNRYSSIGATLVNPKKARHLLLYGVWAPILRFKYDYFLRLGFLDGYEGLLWHIYHAVYTSLKYAKAWDAARKR